MNTKDTICAISTPPGKGGIAVIRVSGTEAINICNHIFIPKKRSGDLKTQNAYTIEFGQIATHGYILDEVLVSVFHAPHSYTGEDIVEISCHGSVYIQQEIIKLLLAEGCRLATAGEFTLRAYLNGKFDLSQAEAIADLIASSSAATHQLAMQQMRGGFSHELAGLRDKLLEFVSMVELELDFSDEDVEFADRKLLTALAWQIRDVITRLANSFSVGNAIKEGIPVAIVGETNAGKSTLLNQLLKEEKAIVSEIPGTTRDVIEDTINIQGLLFRFIDTAGIRDTEDTIELLGIERTFKKIEQASIILWVIDLTAEMHTFEQLASSVIDKAEGKKLILVLNKTDSLTTDELSIKEKFFKRFGKDYILISAKTASDFSSLEHLLLEASGASHLGGNDTVVTNIRHYEALMNAQNAIQRVLDGLESGISGDFLSQDIRECMYFLGGITGGEITTDELLGNIFNNFCIGK